MVKENLDYKQRTRWKNRRRMAWIALISIILFTVAMLFYVPVDRLEKLVHIADFFYVAMVAIIGSYMGFTTMSTMKEMSMMRDSNSKNNKDENEEEK